MGKGTNHMKSSIYIKRDHDMLGRNRWPEKNSVGPPASSRDVQDTTFEDTKISDDGFNGDSVDVVENFSDADPMLCDGSAITHDGGGVYNYSLNGISDAENNKIGFLDSGDKESNDDLFYGWGDIESFEDVDNMLRSCDSTFGLKGLNDEDDLCWFSSAQPSEDTEAMITDDVKPDIMSEDQRNSLLQVEDFLNNSESNHDVEDEYRDTTRGQASDNVSGTSLQKEDIPMLDEEELLAASTFEQAGDPYSHFNCEQASDHVSACEVKSENKPNPLSASDESYTSKQGQYVESLHGPTVDERCRKGFGKRVNLQPGQVINPMVCPDAATIQTLGLNNGQIKAAGESETSNKQESSCVSSVDDDISLEATSFRQLQQIINQLDVRTKLCIRDSLYRLAKSAEQRHNGGNRQMKGAAGEADKYVGFMDMEADTNPIDRSVAHLLFHRPSFSSDKDVLSYKSHPMIPQPNSNPSLRIEETPEHRTETKKLQQVSSSQRRKHPAM